ncbi:hypothetical protein L1987_06285 [Smallanthus sonchifolius]|uniref:Uncharacterized protein n=1 Tax=Smallanthus sonchifolius TaxID=185202 RepID=A0ACB9JXQ8_9ASTR|nr:hypothetical protein L1987_06285 [Smallanthus sonchifolius]
MAQFQKLKDRHNIPLQDIILATNNFADDTFIAKGGFGRVYKGAMEQEFTFLASNVSGTHGYLDPQYQHTGVLSKESDVYSFGVVLFEVLCGRLAMVAEYHDERRFLCNFVKRRYKDGTFNEIIMANLRKQIKPYSLQTFSCIAYECLNESRSRRPSMKSVVKELQSSFEYQIGLPTKLWGSSMDECGSSWSLLLDHNLKLRKITIDHEEWIFSIGFTVEDLSGSLISSQHGGTDGRSGGELSEVTYFVLETIIFLIF